MLFKTQDLKVMLTVSGFPAIICYAGIGPWFAIAGIPLEYLRHTKYRQRLSSCKTPW